MRLLRLIDENLAPMVIGAVALGAAVDAVASGLALHGGEDPRTDEKHGREPESLGSASGAAGRAVVRVERDGVEEQRRDLTINVIAGAAGGLAGGTLMTAAMTAGRTAGVLNAPLPLKVERWGRHRLGLSVPRREHGVAQGIHLAYSLSLGAGYGLLQHARALPVIPSGPLYGLAVYAGTVASALPALGIVSPPSDQAKTTVARQVMMHVVFGTVTAVVFGRVRKRLRRP